MWIEGARMGTSVISPLLMPAKVRVFLGSADYWGIEQLDLNDGRSDRQIANEWICRVLGDCLSHASGRCETIKLAGANWLGSSQNPTDSSTDPAIDES
jgi:hypothetical protein